MVDVTGLAGKKVLIAGGGQGIGEACSLLFAEAGADIAILDVERGRAEAVAARVEALGRRAAPVAGDLLDEAAVDALFDAAEAALGGIDVLVTVVGSTKFVPIVETSMADWDIEQRINLRYVFQIAKRFAARRIALGQPGSAVFVASVSGMTSAPRHAPYGAAKAGLIHLAKSMAVEWALDGIRVNAVSPGSIITPRLPDTPEWREMIERSTLPMQRRGMPEEIAKVVLFLASDMASYVTGHTVPVDGGLMAANVVATPPKLKSARAG